MVIVYLVASEDVDLAPPLALARLHAATLGLDVELRAALMRLSEALYDARQVGRWDGSERSIRLRLSLEIRS